MNVKKIINTLSSSFVSGLLVSIGGVANLLSTNKALGAFLFSLGLFFIVEFKFKLFTGAIGYALDNNKENNLLLLVIIFGNLLGTLFVSLLLSFTRINSLLEENAQLIVNTKLNDSWYSVLILSIFCGILIFLGVDNYKKSNNNLSKVFGIVISIMVFILSSYEHCIANMFYFSISNMWNIKSIFYLLLMIIGNSIGGLLIPAIIKLMNKTKEE